MKLLKKIIILIITRIIGVEIMVYEWQQQAEELVNKMETEHSG